MTETLLKCACGESVDLAWDLRGDMPMPAVICPVCKRIRHIQPNAPEGWFLESSFESVLKCSQAKENCIVRIDECLSTFFSLADRIVLHTKDYSWSVDFILSMEKYCQAMGHLRITYILIENGFSRLPAGYDPSQN